MKQQAFNPYLPLYEYVPDGEPYVFDGRVYIYGSHDSAGGQRYCENDYVVWSAPVENLAAWRCEGVSYRKTQDPSNPDGRLDMWAPDVCVGPDGRYYLYYCLAFNPEVGVAVSDSPAGPFAFYGHVRYPQSILGGKLLNENLPFDPAVFRDDDGRVYLYYGFSPSNLSSVPEDSGQMLDALKAFGVKEEYFPYFTFSPGAMVAELEPDMLTLKEEPRMMVPGGSIAAGTGFAGHGFFEASSLRKIGGKYYFVYSSELSHELCYATSDRPDSGFVFGGTVVSNGDVGYKGNTVPVAMTGNNHGGLVEIGGAWYVFYHRQTQGTETSRQGCAEPIHIAPDGSIAQVEITSCGLNGGPLAGSGTYPAAIACNLASKTKMEKIQYGSRMESQPFITEEAQGVEEKDAVQYIHNIHDGVVAGFKTFAFATPCQSVGVTLRGKAKGTLAVATGKGAPPVGSVELALNSAGWQAFAVPVSIPAGTQPLFFTYTGEGSLDMRDFTL